MDEQALHDRIESLRTGSGCAAIGVQVFDYETDRTFSHEGDRWFHAASTMKVAVLLALFHAVDTGRVRLEDRLHVRNRFRSIVDRSIFRVQRDRDADSAVHRRVGRSMKLIELAEPMITRSSNLATNLLLEFLTPDYIQSTLTAAKVDGVRVLRGVEDSVAFDRGLNNTVTPSGLVALFRLLRENRLLPESARNRMLAILLAQEFNSMIPALLPDSAQVAHKTGEISTCTHDAGLVLLPGRRPYAVAILTEHPPGLDDTQKLVAKVSRLVYEFLTS
ncbi:beta-lactamase [Chthoniobacter flavus Ellin428]|uniref:beta-lactamase n=1 Tax=Chthoniobacter flavus Ellin428 TaxID=497964 RepID=B4CW47_9BACT|nr:serine hydrolase [Chthoniobacter flavus]EDY21639.1 beta-lactamase [Chthoniobacter flavus Ellin428]TCO95577.1 beta-lactamase class A [Chthoniobacter flavus]